MDPRTAFFAPWTTVPAEEAPGQISAELVAAYPPGVPILAPGELVTPELLGALRRQAAEAAASPTPPTPPCTPCACSPSDGAAGVTPASSSPKAASMSAPETSTRMLLGLLLWEQTQQRAGCTGALAWPFGWGQPVPRRVDMKSGRPVEPKQVCLTVQVVQLAPRPLPGFSYTAGDPLCTVRLSQSHNPVLKLMLACTDTQ